MVTETIQPLKIKATGHGCRQMTRTDRFGFPRQKAKQTGMFFGFLTGDIVRADVSKGKNIGCHVGRVQTRASGSFNIQARARLITGVSHHYCNLLQKKDGYSYGA